MATMLGLGIRRAVGACRASGWSSIATGRYLVGGRGLSGTSESVDSDRDVRVTYLENELRGIVVFAFNRPAVKNAMSINLMKELDEGISSVKSNHDVRAVIVKSDVPGVFCAGADLKERKMMKEEEVPHFVRRARRIVTDLSELPMPVIAALDGVALGGGLEIALATDIRVAADSAKMGLVETRLAIMPGAGGTLRLPRLIGLGKAKEMIFTAKVVTGEEAQEIGLVEYAVPQNEDSNAAYLKALEIAREIKDKGPIAVAVAKKAINDGMQMDLNTALKNEEYWYAQVIPTEDRMEALKAFAEKRQPVFKGK